MPTPEINRHIHLTLMLKTLQTLQNLLTGLDQQTAARLRDPDDGDKGWTTLEVLCHLRDFDGFFRQRAQMMITQDNPNLPAYDHEALALERSYNAQNLKLVLAELVASRHAFHDFFTSLEEAQWQSRGIHPENGPWTMTDALMQVGHHDANHIEQITRILAQR